MATILKDAAYMALPMNIKRGNPIPLDTTTVWYDQDELEAYAASNPTAYVGQIVVLVDETGLTATAYMISNTSGTLVRLAATTSSGDLASDVATLQSQVATLVASVGTKLEESTITATNLWAAVEEIKNATGATVPEYSLAKKESANENAAATYYLTKDGARVGVEIDIPKDMVVSSGSVETYTQETLPSGVETPGTYIVLVLANATNDKLYIAADSLIEYVTSGSSAGDPVFITVDPTTHKITATLTDGSIAKAKLDATVQASLAKADAAVIGNAAITAGTHAKITYDEKGLVTGGEDLSESDLPALSIGKITGLQTALSEKISNVKIGGTALPVNEQAVEIPQATALALGLVKSSEAENQVTVLPSGAMEVHSLNINKLTQTEGETLILNGGNSSLVTESL